MQTMIGKMDNDLEEMLKKALGGEVEIHAIDMSELKNKIGIDDISKIFKGQSKSKGLPHMGLNVEESIEHAVKEVAFMEEIAEVSLKHDKCPTDLIETMAAHFYTMYVSESKMSDKEGIDFLLRSQKISNQLIDVLEKSPLVNNGDEMVIGLLTTIKAINMINRKHEKEETNASKIKNRDKADKINDLLGQLAETLKS